MKRCANAYKGCNGTTLSYKTHFCGDCYRAWQHGGAAAVAADIALRSTPKHECVGQAQLAEKDAEIARLTDRNNALRHYAESRSGAKVCGHDTSPEVAEIVKQLWLQIRDLQAELQAACRCETLAATVRMYRDELDKAGSGGTYRGHPVHTEVMDDITALQKQARHLQAELQDMRPAADLGVAVATAVAPCFRPDRSPSQAEVVELIRRRCIGTRAGKVAPTPGAKEPERRDRAIERLEGRLNLHTKRINCTQNWLALSIVAAAITGFVLVKHLVG